MDNFFNEIFAIENSLDTCQDGSSDQHVVHELLYECHEHLFDCTLPPPPPPPHVADKSKVTKPLSPLPLTAT